MSYSRSLLFLFLYCVQNIEDGQVFRKRRKKKSVNDPFKVRQEARVREKPLPEIKKKPKNRAELAADTAAW